MNSVEYDKIYEEVSNDLWYKLNEASLQVCYIYETMERKLTELGNKQPEQIVLFSELPESNEVIE